MTSKLASAALVLSLSLAPLTAQANSAFEVGRAAAVDKFHSELRSKPAALRLYHFGQHGSAVVKNGTCALAVGSMVGVNIANAARFSKEGLVFGGVVGALTARTVLKVMMKYDLFTAEARTRTVARGVARGDFSPAFASEMARAGAIDSDWNTLGKSTTDR
jgi:hypothetical protein